MAGSILIVDDDPVQRRLLQAAVTKFGYEAVLAEGGETALAALEAASGGGIAAVVLDLAMPGLDGIGVLKAMRERDIDIPVIVQTAQGGIDTVVSAMRNGAFDFVVKPASPERLRMSIANALKVEALGADQKRAQRRGGVVTVKDIVTRSPAMDKVIRLAQKAAASDIPILIEGESGVGKELVARAIQGSGERRSKPFVTVNCGAIPDNLVESILFGHEKGSFTGATDRHAGKFLEAHTGTLFLDEIGDLPLDVQVKLLRAVQDGEVDPVGGKSTVKVDIRLISATHRDLLQAVKDGRFREDLFYRLNVYPIVVPPLRDRRSDIPQLVRHFMAGVKLAPGAARISAISDEALQMLQALQVERPDLSNETGSRRGGPCGRAAMVPRRAFRTLPRSGTPLAASRSSASRTRRFMYSASTAAPTARKLPAISASSTLRSSCGLECFDGALAGFRTKTLVFVAWLSSPNCVTRCAIDS